MERLLLHKSGKEVKSIMGEIVIKNAVVRKPGYLYYVDGEGNVCEAQMPRRGRPKKVVENVENKG